MTWTDRYRERVNAENLARQAPAVQKKIKEILKEIQDIQHSLYWAIDPEEFTKESPRGDYWATSLIEHAHTLVDMAHEYKAELKANPPPQKIDEDDDLQSA